MEEIKITKKEQKELFMKAMFGSPTFNVIASVLATFVIGAIFTKLGGGVPINVTSTTTSTEKLSAFDVSGTGTAYATPDEAEVNFGYQEEGVSVDAVQDSVNKTINTFIEGLKSLGIKEENIKTTSYNVYPRYDYGNGRSRITGYEVSTNVRVKFADFEMVNSAIDLAAQSGLNQVGGLQFTLSDEVKDKAMSEARKLAIEEASEKAKELAGLAGMKLGRVINVQELGGYEPRPYAMYDMAGLAMEEKVVETEVQPGTSEISVTVTLSYETL